MADYELELLSLWRAQLPQYEGATVPEQLQAAWRDAEQRLSKYVGEFRYSEDESRAVLHQIGALLDAHRQQYLEVLRDPQIDTLPEALRMSLGVDRARQFVIAMYSEAARGLGPWLAGLIGKEIQDGDTAEWRARQDAQDRLVVFAGIRKMDEDGLLAELFSPQATSGLGLVPLAVVGIVAGAVVWTIIGVELISWFFRYRLQSRRLELANRDHKKRCDVAQQKAEEPGPNQEFWQQVLLSCQETNKNIIEQDTETPWTSLVNKALIGATVVGVAYVAATVVAPSIGRGLAERGASGAPS